MRIAIKLRWKDVLWEEFLPVLKEKAPVDVYYNDALPEVIDSEILITTNLSLVELNHFPKLRALFLPKSGTEKIPVRELKEMGVEIKNSHANAKYIAEHAISLALALLHRIPEMHNELKIGNWFPGDDSSHYWSSIQDMRIGIIGYGTIGKTIHEFIRPMCKSVCVMNRSGIYPDDVLISNSISDLLARTDLLFMCLPLNEKTKNLFNEENIHELIGKTIVNVGRAEVIDERSLFDALKSYMIKGYASDVWYNEPNKSMVFQTATMPSCYPFHELNNVLLSPHCATHFKNAKHRYIEDVVRMCASYIESEILG